MKRIGLVVLAILAFAPAVSAQQQQPAQSAQEQLTSIYVNLNYNLAKQLDTANAQIADLQKQLADEKAKQSDKKAK